MISDSISRIYRQLQDIAADDGVTVRIVGDCMQPILRSGVHVQIVRTRFWWPGDVLVFRDSTGRMVAHRLLGFYRRNGRWKLLTQADSARRPDQAVYPEQVLGKAVDIPVTVVCRIRAYTRYLQFALFERFSAGLS